jgi:hypothetical protein
VLASAERECNAVDYNTIISFQKIKKYSSTLILNKLMKSYKIGKLNKVNGQISLDFTKCYIKKLNFQPQVLSIAQVK